MSSSDALSTVRDIYVVTITGRLVNGDQKRRRLKQPIGGLELTKAGNLIGCLDMLKYRIENYLYISVLVD